MTETHRLATRRLREAGHTTLTHPYGHDECLDSHALSPDGRWLATGSWGADDATGEGSLRVWEVAIGRCVNSLHGIGGGVGWPDHPRALQWSADSTRLATAFSTDKVGAWDPFGDWPLPSAGIDVSNGMPRPAPHALAPDGTGVYYRCGLHEDGRPELPGPARPGRAVLDAGVRRREPPFNMSRRLPEVVRRASARDHNHPADGREIRDPVFAPDGTRLYGSNAICVDVATREVVRTRPGGTPGRARPGPDGRLVAVVDTRKGLFFRDASDGQARGTPHSLAVPTSLRWAARVGRPAALVPGPGATGPAVHLLDEDRHAGSPAVAHPEWADDEKGVGDRNAWAWAPDGQGAACLTAHGTVEVWDLSDLARPRRLRSLPAEDTSAVHWGAEDTLVMVGGEGNTRLRFVQAHTGDIVGDHMFSSVEADCPRP